MIGLPVIVHRYEMDRYGDRQEVSTHRVERTAFAPRPAAAGRGSAELTDRSNRVTADAELYVPYGADIRPSDQIELNDGSRWEVSGALERWRGAFANTWTPGAVVPLKRVTG